MKKLLRELIDSFGSYLEAMYWISKNPFKWKYPETIYEPIDDDKEKENEDD